MPSLIWFLVDKINFLLANIGQKWTGLSPYKQQITGSISLVTGHTAQCFLPCKRRVWRWLRMAARIVERFMTCAHWARPMTNSSLQYACTNCICSSILQHTDRHIHTCLLYNKTHATCTDYSRQSYTIWALSQLTLASHAILLDYAKCPAVPHLQQHPSNQYLLNNYYTTSVQSSLTKRLHPAAHGRFNCIQQVAPTWPLLNTCFLGFTQVHNRNSIWTGSDKNCTILSAMSIQRRLI